MSAIERLGLRKPKSSVEYSTEQTQTSDAFGFKWAKRDTYESEHVKENSRNWLFERYCSGSPQELDKMLASGDATRKIILDAGCGSGYSALIFFGDRLKKHDYLGVDISTSVNVAAARFEEAGLPGDFYQANISNLDIPDASVDLIFSEGVLHHTDSTERSLIHLASKLKSGGRFLFYVYAKKAVIREFTDDHIRNYLKDLDDDSAWEALKPLSKLGMELGKLGVELEIPDDIPYLGIKKGKFDIQRFFYWNICKAFYRPEWNLEELNHLNFDWFRPLNCQRHTPEEVKAFCNNASLEVEHINVQESGITVVAVKR